MFKFSILILMAADTEPVHIWKINYKPEFFDEMTEAILALLGRRVVMFLRVVMSM